MAPPIVALSALLWLPACHEGDADPLAPAATEPVEGEVERDPLPPLPRVAQTQIAVARTLKFARHADGVSHGFDLDGRVSDRSDRDSCGQVDFVDPGGVEGIDNAFAWVLPIIESVGGRALEGLVQSAINEGDLLVMFELSGIDSLERDDAVELTLLRGLGLPFVGTDARIEAWQTFDVDPEAPWSRASARIEDGVLEAGPVEFDLPIYIFDFEFLVTVTEARVRVEMGEDGPVSAVIGGVIMMENILDIANNIEGGVNIPGTLDTIGRTFTDMVKQDDGQCAGISVALTLDLAGAFFYTDVERADR